VNDRLSAALADRYRIERELGAGGMATVYLAEDLKHDRKVAIKVLKPELAAVLGAERFVVEIKTTAAMSHPHILPLFDSGTADGFLFYVMPYIQGETIREKLTRETQFGVDEAVRVAREVADALDYAHRHGVIHRDIKPENILLHDGRAMVMDFGIALAVSAAAGGRMTETGLSLGTPHYMSPEQATAEKEISARSDIYSIGSVLYEMLTGSPPHTGANAQQIIMKIISEPAEPVTKYRKSVPPNVAAAVAKAVEKLPADRFESAKAFADALGNVAFFTTQGTAAYAPAAARGWRRAMLPAGVLGALAIGFALGATRKPSGVGAVLPGRFVLSAPPAMAMNANIRGSDVAISPDGRLVVYSAGSSGALYVRPIDALSGSVLAGTEGSFTPVFSPDGKWIAFATLTGGGVMKVRVDGGPVTPLADLPATLGLSWAGSDTIVASTYVDLVAIPAAGGAAIPLTRTDSAAGAFGWRRFPEMLPGGGVVYTARQSDGSWRLAVLDRKNGTERLLPQVGSYARWSTSGHVIYHAGGALWALPFDPVRMEPTGAPVSVLQDVTAKLSGAANYAIARDAGTLVYSSSGSAFTSVVWIDTLGKQTPLEGLPPGQYRDPTFSPDGNMLALVSGSHLFTYDIRRATLSQLTRDSVENYAPVWTPDSRNIVFASNRGGLGQVYLRRADGTGSDSLLFTGRAGLIDVRPMAVTGDGSSLLVTRVPASLQCWFGLVPLRAPKEDDDSADFVHNSVCNDFPALSPDGRWVAYSANFVGVVERFPEGGERHQLSGGVGQFPRWSRDGRTVYYQTGDSTLAVTVQTTGTLSVSRPRLLFRADFMQVGVGRRNVDVGPNGRFVAVVNRESAGGSSGAQGALPGSVVIIQDWASELKRIMAKK